MTLTEEGSNQLWLRWGFAVQMAKNESPEGFEFIGFLWGHDFTHGPFLAKADGPPGPIGQAIYGKVNP